jgi:hypothetical protein
MAAMPEPTMAMCLEAVIGVVSKSYCGFAFTLYTYASTIAVLFQ